MKDAILKTVKEGLRIAFFAALSAVIAWATDKLSGLDPSSTFVVVSTVVLRLVDKYVHENDNVALNGISPV